MHLGLGLGVSLGSGAPLVLDDGVGVIFGASIEAANHSTSGSSSSNAKLQSDGRAHILLANAMAGQPLSFHQAWARRNRANLALDMRGGNEAFGGKTIRSINRVILGAGAVSRAKHVFISPGRNGITQVPIGETQATYALDCDLLRAQGRTIWHLGLWMRTSYAEGDTSWNYLIALDQWMRTYAAANGDQYVDLSVPMHLDGAPNAYTVDAAKIQADGTHQNGAGGWAMALYLADQLRAYFGSTWPDRSAALLNTALNKVLNPYMTGTGGSLANGATGQVADQYWLQRPASGATCAVAGELIDGPDGRKRQRITITPTGVVGANETILFRTNPNRFGVVDETWEFTADLVKHNGSAALVKVQTRIQLGSQPGAETTFFDKLSTDAKNPNEAFELRMGGNGIEYLAASGGTSTTVGLDIVVDPGIATPIVIETTGWSFMKSALPANYPRDILDEYDVG